jgi:hypothetical protein
MRKSLLLAAALVAGSIGAASAHADALLYSFEPGDSPSALDGFGNLGGNTLGNSTTVGVTDQTQSLLVTNGNSSFAGFASGSVPAFFTNDHVTAVSLDATVPSGFTYTGGFYLLGITLFDNAPANAYTGMSFQVAGSDEQSIYPLPAGLGTGVPQHVSIPLSGSDPITFNPTTYGQLIDNGWVTTGIEIFEDHNAPLTFAVDKVSAVGVSVPEPASIGVAAIGAMGLLARRRRAAKAAV